MTKSELIEALQEMPTEFGDPEVFIELAIDGKRSTQSIEDVFGDESRMVLAAQSAIDADPLSQVVLQ